MPAAIAIPAIIGAAGSIGSAVIGSRASTKAGQQISQTGQNVAQSIDKATAGAVDAGYKGIEQANSALNTNTDRANQVQSDVYSNLNGAIAPYAQAGQHGMSMLDQALSPGGDLSKKFSFDPSDLENDPGYQFTLAQGLKAVTNSASARGLVGSGATMKSLGGYSQGLAQTTFQNSYNRALTTFQTNHNNTLGDLTTLANFGQNANQQLIGVGQNYANNTSGNYMSLANGLANTAMNGNQYVGNVGLSGTEASGNARMGAANGAAAGTMGSANSLAGGLNGVANAGMNAYYQNQSYMPPPVTNVTPTMANAAPRPYIPLNATDPRYNGSAGAPPAVGAYPG